MLWTLALLGGLRELIGAGTLFSGIDMVFPGCSHCSCLPTDYPGFLLAMLPPGAFILLGCLIAWKNWVEARAAARDSGQRPLPRPPLPLPTMPEAPGNQNVRPRREPMTIFTRLRAGNPAADDRTRPTPPLPVADRRHPVGAGDRQERQPRHPPAVCRRADAAGHTGARRKRPGTVHQPHRPLAGQGAKRHRHLSAAARPARRRGAALARAELEALPGVGRKTANVVLNTPSASRRSPSTRTSSASPTAPGWRRARRRWLSSANC
jgi:hypothetical protein